MSEKKHHEPPKELTSNKSEEKHPELYLRQELDTARGKMREHADRALMLEGDVTRLNDVNAELRESCANLQGLLRAAAADADDLRKQRDLAVAESKELHKALEFQWDSDLRRVRLKSSHPLAERTLGTVHDICAHGLVVNWDNGTRMQYIEFDAVEAVYPEEPLS